MTPNECLKEVDPMNSDDFLTLASERYSVRRYTGERVRETDMARILQAGYVAPTACNLQPQRIFVLQSANALEKLRRCTRCHFDCPTALLVCQDRNVCWVRKYDGKPSGDIDAGIVTTHMMLEAAALGVGSCWVMHFDPAAVREEFALPDNLEPVAILTMGYPAQDAAPYPGHSQFRPMEELVTAL
ncbi:MAG: nitroreductase family protein [Aristaeellaceae bacterium]